MVGDLGFEWEILDGIIVVRNSLGLGSLGKYWILVVDRVGKISQFIKILCELLFDYFTGVFILYIGYP